MSFPVKAPSLSIALGGEGIFRASITIGMNTTHTAVRGT